MSLKRHTGSRCVWLAAAWLAALFCFVTAVHLGMPACAQAQTEVASIEVEQNYSSDSSGVNKTFTYVLEPVTEGALLPDGATDEYTWTMTGDDSVLLEIPFDVPLSKEYKYRVYQRVKSPKDGFTYDKAVYTLHLLAANAKADEGIVIPYDAEGLKPSEVSWTVKYKTPEEDDPEEEDDPDDEDDSDEEDEESGSHPQTGDTMLSVWLMVALGAALLVLVIVAVLLRREARRTDKD